MKKLDVRFCLGYRDFELFALCGFLNFYLCLFFGVGIEEGVVEKLCLGLSTTPI